MFTSNCIFQRKSSERKSKNVILIYFMCNLVEVSKLFAFDSIQSKRDKLILTKLKSRYMIGLHSNHPFCIKNRYYKSNMFFKLWNGASTNKFVNR